MKVAFIEKLLARFASVYGMPSQADVPMLIHAWQSALEGHSEQEVEDAATQCLRTLRFFPTPVDVIEKIVSLVDGVGVHVEVVLPLNGPPNTSFDVFRSSDSTPSADNRLFSLTLPAELATFDRRAVERMLRLIVPMLDRWSI